MHKISLSSLLVLTVLGGCTLLPEGADRTASGDVRGSAPATQAQAAQIAPTPESRQCA